MKQFHILLCVMAVLLCGTALAHTGVKNPAVKARMASMSGIAAELKTIGEMAKGKTAFDQQQARAAAAAIAVYAAQTPELFAQEEDDPMSEAKPEVWQNFDDFTAKSDALERLSRDLATRISSQADVQTAVKELAQSCKDCHRIYRE